MTEQHDTTGQGNSPLSSPSGQDRLESLICALMELKSNISLVEQQHPALSNDLSSLCDLAINHLNRPEDVPAMTVQPSTDLQPQPLAAAAPGMGQESKTGCILNGTGPDERPAKRKNFLLSILDWAGDGMVNGLDKMGDGVIFVFEKLLSLGPQKKTGASEDPV